MPHPLTIHAVGDVAPRRPFPAEMFAGTRAALGRADLLFGQLECPLSTRGTPAPSASLAMRSDPACAALLGEVGFHAMSVAGNHALDFGPVALADTLAALREAGIQPCGAGPELASARAPVIVTAADSRVAFLAYSSILPAGYAATANRPGCAPLRAYTHYRQLEPDQPGTAAHILTFADRDDLAALCADIAAARAVADVVVLSLHWGVHFARAVIADYQREVAHAAIAAGADLIVGHHPHLLKGVEIHHGKPILYSLGNFAIEQPSAFKEDVHLDEAFALVSAAGGAWAPAATYMLPEETRHTAIARVTVADGAIRLSLLPCRIDDNSVPQLLHGDDPAFGEVVRYLAAVTAEAGLRTGFTVAGDQVLVA